MRTIVINTSKEAQNTKLASLFSTPFDRSSLIWLESNLPDLGGNAQVIRQNLLEHADTVDRDYQLIVLVDLYPFPCGNYRDAIEMYKKLLSRYVTGGLISILETRLSLAPRGVSIYFVDSAKSELGLELPSMPQNPVVEAEQRKEKEKEEEERAAARVGKKDKDGNLSDEGCLAPEGKKKDPLSPDDKLLIKLFGWELAEKTPQFSWKLKASVLADEYLDFTEIFKETSSAIAASHETADKLGIALREVLQSLNMPTETGDNRIPVHILTCKVNRDNQQSKLEGFFRVFANIFTCVQENCLYDTQTEFDSEQIKGLLLTALKKYCYFSREENIDVTFEPLVALFDIREKIYERMIEEAAEISEYKGKTKEEVAERVMKDTTGKASSGQQTPEEEQPIPSKLTGIDRQFYELAEEIFRNYDADTIRQQNNTIIKKCLKGLWNWRSRRTSIDFQAMAQNAEKTVSSSKTEGQSASSQRDDLETIREDYEKARDEMIDQVTEAEHKLAGNQDILLETRDLVLQYSHWMRKGRIYMISVLGAIFTVIASVWPFFYTQWCLGGSGILLLINGALGLGAAAFLYAIAASTYVSYIHRKKMVLLGEIGGLKDQSEKERLESLEALYLYYSRTLVKAETLCLLWREIQRRDQQNAQESIQRNYHINYLKKRADDVKGFITMMKLDTKSSGDTAKEKDYDPQGLRLNAKGSCYDQDNRCVYSILPDAASDQDTQRKEE